MYSSNFAIRTPRHDGTSHLVVSPVEIMQRLAALAPRPRLHLIHFHVVIASNAKRRAMVMPQGPDEVAEAVQPVACEANCAHDCPVRLSWVRLLERLLELLLEHCSNRSGELQTVAATLQAPATERILTHFGLKA